MRNEIEDLKQQAREYAKQQLKKQVKEAAKKVGQQIWSAIAPVLPYVIAAILILIVIVGCVDWDDVTASAASGGSSSGLESTSSTSWEQFKRFVLLNEDGTRVDEYGNEDPNGAYYIVEDDSWNNPTIGHGLCLKSSGSYLNVEAFSSFGIDSKKLADDYFNGIYGKVPVEICDSIWNDLLYAKYESVASQCQDLNLTEYQLYALTDVKYRRGNIDGFQSEYNSKWTSSDDKYGEDPSSESYSMDSLYSFFNNGFTNTSSGVYTRKKRQWVLFKYGYYETLQEYWQESYTGNFNNITVYNDDGTVNEEKIQELQLALESSFNLAKGNLSGNNIGGQYNKESCEKVQGDYFGFSYWDNAGFPRSQNGGIIYQCPWWAIGRASEYLGKNVSIRGNGGDIYYNAANLYERGTTPKPNSLVSYTSSSSEFGHVAYVEAVDTKNNCYYISHAGSGKSWFGIQKVMIGQNGPWAGYYLVGFVYLDQPL